MKNVGDFFNAVGITAWFVTGIWGFFLCIGIISDAAGFWGVVAAIFIGPITFIAAPLYAGFEYNNWLPLILNYGGSIVSLSLIGLGGYLSDN